MSPCPLEKLLPGWQREATAAGVAYVAGDLRFELPADLAEAPDVPWALVADRLLTAQDYRWRGEVEVHIRREGSQVVVGVRRVRSEVAGDR